MHRIILVVIAVLFAFASVLSAQDEPNPAAENAPIPLDVWLPVPLLSDETGVAYQLLSEHTAAFSQNNAIGIEFRIKEIGKVGGIMATIRAGSEVAPGALPDIALIRRRDFTPTQASQYLQSMETLFSSSLINDLSNGLAFGQIRLDDDFVLYGLPYLFDLLLAVYAQPLDNFSARLSFDDVLTSEAAFRFPAARTNGLNQTFYLQYLAAGGLTPGDGGMTVDGGALEAVLTFYQGLVQQGMITADVLSYQTSAAYRTDFLSDSDQAQLAVFNASDYLRMIQEEDTNLFAANIPSPSGAGLSIRDGWLWVIVTPDRGRQASSARFLEWMMDPGFHAEFAKALFHLPTQPDILEASLPETVDRQFFAELLANATLPLPETAGGSAPRLMQEALVQVLQGEENAAAATRHVLDQLAER